VTACDALEVLPSTSLVALAASTSSDDIRLGGAFSPSQDPHSGNDPVILMHASQSLAVHLLLLLSLLADLLADLGMPFEGDALALALAQLDEQRTGTVSFGQFLLWWKE
jgi:hypothetical protein